MEVFFLPSTYSIPLRFPFQLLSGLLTLGISIFVLTRNYKAAVNRAFFLLTITAAIWILGGAMVGATKSDYPEVYTFWSLFLLTGALLSPPSNYAFNIYFTKLRKQKIFVYIFYAISAFALPLLYFTNSIYAGFTYRPWGRFIVLGKGAYPFIALAGILAALVIINFIWRYRHPNNAAEKPITRLLLIGFLIAYLSNLDYLAAYGIRIPLVPTRTGYIFVLIWVMIAGYTITRYEILDVRRIVVRALGYIVLTALVLVSFGTAFLFAELLITREINVGLLITSTLLFTFTLPFFHKIRSHAQNLVDQLFSRARFDFKKSVFAFHHNLRSFKSRTELLANLFTLLSHNIFISSLQLIIFFETESLILSKSKKQEKKQSKPLLFKKHFDFLSFLKNYEHIITQDQLLLNPKFVPVLKTGTLFFEEFHGALVMPLISRDKLIGILVLGPKKDERPFTGEDIELLSTLMNPLSIALENAEFYENIKNISDLKSQFVHIASHQLRTPVSILRWTLNFLKHDSTLSQTQHAHLKNAEETVHYMVRLIDSLLDVSMIEEGTLLLTLSSVSLHEIIDGIIAEMTPLWQKKKIIITKNFQPALPLISLDKEKIKQVLFILIDNAIKYNPKGGTVTISGTANQKTVEIKITDTGIGIPKLEQKNLFTKFYRGSNVTPMETRGSGLGLFIARTYVELHHGNIWLKSQEGKGTTVYISLPVS